MLHIIKFLAWCLYIWCDKRKTFIHVVLMFKMHRLCGTSLMLCCMSKGVPSTLILTYFSRGHLCPHKGPQEAVREYSAGVYREGVYYERGGGGRERERRERKRVWSVCVHYAWHMSDNALHNNITCTSTCTCAANILWTDVNYLGFPPEYSTASVVCSNGHSLSVM